MPAPPKTEQSSQEKRALGAFYTQGNPFVFTGFSEWFKQVPPDTVIVEPFAGSGQIPKLLEEAGYQRQWALYDVDEKVKGATHQDTLAEFPQGYTTTITNPPYLSYHFAKRKGLDLDKDYFRGYPSLYLTAIDQALENCDYVAMIIPESFVTSNRFRERLEHVISLPFQMFDDTEMPTALALFGPKASADFVVWRQDQRLGRFSELAEALEKRPCAERIRFNVISGQIGLKAIDNTSGPTIAFCPPEEIPAEKIKHSARLVSRIEVEGLKSAEPVIEAANRLLSDWREKTEDVLLTAFKGTRNDGRFRRRLDFANARTILSHALCEVEGHDHAEER